VPQVEPARAFSPGGPNMDKAIGRNGFAFLNSLLRNPMLT